TETKWFLPNLLVMHALLLPPLLSSASSRLQPKLLSIPTQTLYVIIATLSLLIRSRTLASTPYFSDAVKAPLSAGTLYLENLWSTLHSHPANSSLGYDVIWTAVSYLIWVASGEDGTKKPRSAPWILANALACTVASIAVVAPGLMAAAGTASPY
ncbi:hypothetical protein BS47DRAFT_1303334, partial [Hydnum rufescens UP504]